jgi:hypothetical protein
MLWFGGSQRDKQIKQTKHLRLVWPMLLAQVSTHCSTNFLFQNQFLRFSEFSMTKVAQNSISPTQNASQNYKMISIKVFLVIGFFNKYQKCTWISVKTFVLILSKFQWKICSIFNNFCIIGRNIMKSPGCTCTHWRLSNDTKTIRRGVPWFKRFEHDKQTNKLA